MKNAVRCKGSKSIAVTWTKGHAKQKDIDEGRSTPLRKIGNDKSDERADWGVLEHTSGLMQLSGYYAAKQRIYKNMVIRIHAMFLRVQRGNYARRETSNLQPSRTLYWAQIKTMKRSQTIISVHVSVKECKYL